MRDVGGEDRRVVARPARAPAAGRSAAAGRHDGATRRDPAGERDHVHAGVGHGAAPSAACGPFTTFSTPSGRRPAIAVTQRSTAPGQVGGALATTVLPVEQGRHDLVPHDRHGPVERQQRRPRPRGAPVAPRCACAAALSRRRASAAERGEGRGHRAEACRRRTSASHRTLPCSRVSSAARPWSSSGSGGGLRCGDHQRGALARRQSGPRPAGRPGRPPTAWSSWVGRGGGASEHHLGGHAGLVTGYEPASPATAAPSIDRTPPRRPPSPWAAPNGPGRGRRLGPKDRGRPSVTIVSPSSGSEKGVGRRP